MNSEKSLSIKAWAEDDRPREKLMLKGKHALSDAELLAIIMGTGSREESAVDLAKRILKKAHHNWHELAKWNIQDFCKFKGIGEAKAISIITTLEIGRRRIASKLGEKPKINSSAKVFELMSELGDLSHEEFWILLLNNDGKVLAKKQMSSGGMTQTIVDSRRIFQLALEHKAVSIILVHNHPSGKLKPSDADRKLTQNLIDAGKIMNINILDHVIITQTQYYSFADNGLI